jgi:hypothetical protein
MRTTLLALAATALALGTSALAQTPAPLLARTKDVHPDLHGVWEGRWTTPLERPPEAPSLVLTVEQATAMMAGMEAGRRARPVNANPDSDFDLIGLALVKGEYRSSLVVDPPDGRLPLTEEGKAARARFQRELFDNPEERMASERCVGGPGRAPMHSVPTNSYMRIIQSPGHVVLHTEALDDVRILALGGKHGPDAVLDLQGDSIAWWNGDTLVVETENFRADDPARFSPPMSVILLSPKTTVIERFTRVSDKEIVYRFTVSDPVLYTQPWTAETSFIRTSARMFEYACHEANYSLTNILRGGREMERRTAMAATVKQ